MHVHLLLPLASLCVVASCQGQPATSVCLDVEIRGTADLGYPVVLTVSDEPIVGHGAYPTQVHVGEHYGTLASIVTHREMDGDGVVRGTLIHYFEATSGDSFWTEDEAVCMPTPGRSCDCDAIAQMRVAGGTGRFQGANGSLRNEGCVSMTDSSPQTSPYGTLVFHTTGRVCVPDA